MSLDMSKFKIKAHLSVPLLKIENDKQYAVTIETKMVKADATPPRKVMKDVTDPETGEVKKMEVASPVKEPPTTCQVTDLESGERKQMIVGAVMLGELGKRYPDDSYVGKSFVFRVFSIQGKQYKGIELAEVEVETPAEADAAEKPAKKK